MTFPDYFDGEQFVSLTAFPAAAPNAVFSACTFKQCRMQTGSLSSYSFENCVFEECDLSLMAVRSTAFKQVRFQQCKMEGINFFDCCRTVLEMRFEGCNLRYSSFAQLPLRHTEFIDCSLREVSFLKTDLLGASFTRCDLARAVFLQSNLEKADFSSAYNFTLDPDVNRMRKARFSVYGLPGLLEKYGIEVE